MAEKPVKVEKPRGRKPYSQTYYYTKDRKGRSAKPSVAGVLLIFVGVVGLLIALVLGAAAVMFYNFGGEIDVNCSFLGQVTDPQGTPIEGATVSVVGTSLDATTDENGFFALMNLDMGLNEIRIQKAGYTIQQNVYWLNDNGNINISQFREEKAKWERDQFWDGDFWNDDDSEGYDDDYYDDENYENEEEFDRNHNYYIIRLNEGIGIEKSDFSEAKITEAFCLICTVCIGGVLICSIITTGAGILAVMRKGYAVAIIGCITGIFTLAFPVNLIFCVIAFFLLVLSYEEFFPRKKKKPFRMKKKTITWKGTDGSPPPKRE